MSANDWKIWLEHQEGGRETPFGEGVVFVAEGETPELVAEGYVDPSYLSEDDLANPDIAANVAAHRETVALVTWAAEDEGEKAYGYWRGPEGAPLDQAAIVSLDSEGSYELLPGRTLTEALCWELQGLAHEFDELAALCAEAGVPVPASADALESPESPEPPTDPAGFHEARYRHHLETR